MGAKDVVAEELSFNINKRLPIRIYIGYGLGHILNDICAAMWLSYLLVFFHLVLEFENGQAGILVMLGQVADALATPFIGYNSDKDHDWWIYKFGKRKIWYFLGTICVIFSFPFIFAPCIYSNHESRVGEMLYYAFFIIIFQLGWASAQIAHMSLIPEITSDKHQRTRLVAIRNGATVVASILVYLVTWGILHMSGGSENKVGPNDAEKFQYIVWSVMAFGIICSILFYILIKEPQVIKNGSCDNNGPPLTFKELFCNYNLYLIGTVYMCSRLFINLIQVFISLYLAESLGMVASSLALVPLAIYIASFVTSFPVGQIGKLVGRKATYIIGAIMGVIGCLWIQWGQGDDYKSYYIFVVSTLLGCASTIVLVSSLDITTDMIGTKTNKGAFIYGIMSFADKFSNGFAVEVIQGIHIDGNAAYYRNILTFVCGGPLILGAAAVILVNNKRKDKKRHISTQALSESIASIS